MKVSRIYFFQFVIVIVILISSCKNNLPTGPDTGNDERIHIEASIHFNSQPLEGIWIYLSGNRSQRTRSGADGSFFFYDLPAGTYYVTPTLEGYSFIPGYYEFSVSVDDLIFVAKSAVFGTDLGSIMADFTARDQHDQDVSLYDFFGQVILVDFSANWCVHCQNEASHLNELYSEYRKRGFQILTLLISGNNAEWAETYGLKIPVLNDLDRTIFNIYTNGYIPLNILVGRNGNILYEKDGYNVSEIKALINKFL